jgi:hypothetical protein
MTMAETYMFAGGKIYGCGNIPAIFGGDDEIEFKQL